MLTGCKGGGTHSFKDGNTIGTNVPTGGESEPSHESCTQVTEDVPIEIGHHKNVKPGRVLHQLKKV